VNPHINPFSALGEAMTTIGCWVLRLPCLVFGHKWEPQYYDYEIPQLEGWFCTRCYRVEYA
jgi:hypothetical protein